MAHLLDQIDSFQQFARDQVAAGREPPSLDELYDDWRESHPRDDDVLAVQASLRDMEQGETGQPFEEFDQEFRRRNNLSPASP